MRTKVLLISCLLVFVLGCNLFSSADALTFDVGTKISESDPEPGPGRWYYFDSGCMLQTESDYINDVPLILDGNESTGMNKNYGAGHSWLNLKLVFPYPLNVTNVTIKPYFGGSATNCSLNFYIGSFFVNFGAQSVINNMTIQINGQITALWLTLNNLGTNQFNFNDIIINYTPGLTTNESMIQAFQLLSNTINSLQNQINIINSKINTMGSDINIINQTQQQLSENITNLWSIYNELNNTIQNLKTEIYSLNSTIYQNITQLESDLFMIKNDISGIQKNINNLTLDIDQLPALKDQINNTLTDIFNLNQNLTILQESIPDEYDDTALKSQILILKDENANLKLEIGNLTSEIDTLNTELNNIKSDLDELKEHDDDKAEDKEGEVETLAYSGIGIGIIGVILAIAAISMLLKKKTPPEMPPEERGVPATEMAPEQPIVEDTGSVVEEEQPQVTPEVQNQQQEELG